MSTNTLVPIRGERPPLRPALVACVVTLLLTCGACVTVSLLAGNALVAWYGAVLSVLLVVAATLATRWAQLAQHYQASAAIVETDVLRLADETLPALARQVRDGKSSNAVISELDKDFGAAHRKVVATVANEIGFGERMRAAALTTCANAAGRVQALTTSMLADLREMEDRHDEKVLADLLRLDHSTAQAGRLADSIAVLTGARSGRRWTKPIVMESVLRGAMSRISAYQRVRLHSTSRSAIVGYAAEGVMHALAELMDNAARFSPPSEEVHVYVEEVAAGAVVTIEDSGLAMSAAALARAEQAVSDEPLDLAMMSGTRLGLAVVGQIARKHGLAVSFRASSRGGTGAVLMIPQRLVTQPRRDPDPPTVRTRTQVPATVGAEAAGEPDGDPDVLPRRRRGRTLEAATQPVKPQAVQRPRPDAGSKFGAFRGARESARRDDMPPSPDEQK